MKLLLKIAFRYIFSKKSTNAINIISGISMAGMAIGSMMLVVLLSVFNGFENVVLQLYNSLNPDIKVVAAEGKVFNPADLDSVLQLYRNDIAAYSFCLEENAYFRYDEKECIGTIKGVDKSFNEVCKIDTLIINGKYNVNQENNDFAVVDASINYALGIDLDGPPIRLEVSAPKRGNKVYINPADAFRTKYLYPSGVFNIRQDAETKYVICDLTVARSLLKYDNEASSLEIKLKNPYAAARFNKKFSKALGEVFVSKTRIEQNATLYKVMKMEKWATYAILSFIMLIISFNIVGSLSMLVIEKERDIAILRSLGFTSQKIKLLFLSVGVLIASIGALMGVVVGFLVCGAQQLFGIIKLYGTGSFLIDSYPVLMKPIDFLLTLITVLAIGIFASWFPAKRSAQKHFSLRQS